MYQEDLHRVFEIINHNLISTCRIGFHSHNNMQLSNALSQEFIRMSYGKRKIIVDGTISGMGRGAGNTPIELVAQYMVSKMGYNYDIDAILDIIDDYMDNIKSRCEWGFTTPYFIAGCYGAHVNNISYLTKKNSIRSRDIRYILNKMGETERKRYDYTLLEKTYMDYMVSKMDDSKAMNRLSHEMSGRDVLLLVPGRSIVDEREKIKKYIENNHPVVISINFIHEFIHSDYVYISNTRRFSYWKNDLQFINTSKIITSNIKRNTEKINEYIICINKLIKCGWNHLDNSTVMLLRLLDMLNINKIIIAGFDGYSCEQNSYNYVLPDMELSNVKDNPIELNEEIASMLVDYMKNRKHNSEIIFLTESRFSQYLIE